MEEHLHQVQSDPRMEDSLEEMEKLIKPAEQTIPFGAEEPHWQEVNNFLKKARGKSAPGPNGIPYKVYKYCERPQKTTLEATEGGNFLTDGWLVAIPYHLTHHVKGKIFFGILARRLTTFMLDNDYMDTLVQNGGVPGVPGCLEHTTVFAKIIEDSKTNHGDLTVLWLDLTNAYGTIPHKLVERPTMSLSDSRNSIQHVPIRAFMDNLTIIAKSVPEGRWILEDLSRRVQDRFCFKIIKDIIPTVQEKPVKSLGKWYRADLNVKESVKEMLIQAETWMTSLEKSGLPNKYKAWGYQHGVLWPLLVYKVPISTVEGSRGR